MSNIDWGHIRTHAKSSGNKPPEWPQSVWPISTEGLSLLGLDHDHALYWDGRRIEIKRTIRLNWWQGLMITIAAFGALAQGIAATLTWMEIKPTFLPFLH